MINRLIELSLRKRSIIVALYLGLAAWGWWALGATPIDAIPDLSDNQVIVFTDWIGHSPQEVEDQVTYPLTVNLQGLAGVRVVRSQSAFGFSMIYVIFEDNIDLYFARARVIERMSLISKTLPAGVTPTTRPASATPFGTRSRVVRRAGAPANLGQKTRSVSSGRHQPPILIAASDHPRHLFRERPPASSGLVTSTSVGPMPARIVASAIEHASAVRRVMKGRHA